MFPSPPMDDSIPKWLQPTLLHPMENCLVKSVISCAFGGGMGLLFGAVFMPTNDLSHIPGECGVGWKWTEIGVNPPCFFCSAWTGWKVWPNAKVSMEETL